MLECVINISEGTDSSIIEKLAEQAGRSLLDVHSDAYHNRSVFTLYGADVQKDAVSITTKAFELLDINNHIGAHPRIGVVDVVPFVPLNGSTFAEAEEACQSFAKEISERFAIPVFIYSKTQTLPEIRRGAYSSLRPDLGPPTPHPRSGSIAVGAREVLVAYNFYLSRTSIGEAKMIAKEVRSAHFRTLGLEIGDEVQLSANLVDPLRHGIIEFYRAVRSRSEISRGELVGLSPRAVIEEVPASLWKHLDLSLDKSIESRSNRLK